MKKQSENAIRAGHSMYCGACDGLACTCPQSRGCYRIVRFRQGSGSRTIKTGLTLEQVQAHCSKESTHGPGWFDGYELMKGVR